MRRVYATPEQYTALTGKAAPADAAQRLATASEDIDDALLTAVYRTDTAGMPTDPEIVQALADAACRQVEYQLSTGDDGSGAADRWDSVSIGPVAMSGRRTTSGNPSDVDLGPRAHRALNRAGLLPGVIW